jgi:hypothetical protein
MAAKRGGTIKEESFTLESDELAIGVCDEGARGGEQIDARLGGSAGVELSGSTFGKGRDTPRVHVLE